MLLFSAGDVVKQTRFIDEKSESEARIAREQLRQMVHYAETRDCRRTTLLHYFAENGRNESCNGCDNCLNPRDTFDGTLAAQKFLSCVFRVQQKSGFAFGLNHIVEVLTGADTEPIRQRRHNELSTYGIGREIKRDGLAGARARTAPARAGGSGAGKICHPAGDRGGRAALRERTPITLTKQTEKPAAS